MIFAVWLQILPAVEAGHRRDIRLSTLEKLAKACGLELWELFDFDHLPHDDPRGCRREHGPS